MADSSIEVLVVEDDPSIQRLMLRWIEGAGYKTRCANDGAEAIKMIEERCPDVVVTDWEMPNIDGLDLCRWMSNADFPQYVYTLVVTSRISTEDMVCALEAGADDFLRKPIDPSELIARIAVAVRVLRRERRLSDLAKSDPLTGLADQRAFIDILAAEWSRAARLRSSLTCVMCDIDFFKRINDTYGHGIGDEVIRTIADMLDKSCRASDVVARVGGEEFCIMLPETSEKDAVLWANRIREKIAAIEFNDGDKTFHVTISIGIADRQADVCTPDTLIDFADQALLVAKQSGRDRVVAYQSLNTRVYLNSEEGDGPCKVFRGVEAQHVMTGIAASLRPEATAQEAANVFLQFRISAATVVDEEGKLIGFLSEKDVMGIMLWPEWWTTPVRKIMRSNVVSYPDNTPALAIFEFLCRVSIRSVIVVRENIPVGIITRGSLLRWSSNTLMSQQGEGESESRQIIESKALHGQIEVTIDTIRNEIDALQNSLGTENADLSSLIVGGSSRVQELVNDILVSCRHLNRTASYSIESSTDDGTSLVPVGTVNTDEINADEQTAIWFPPGCQPEVE